MLAVVATAGIAASAGVAAAQSTRSALDSVLRATGRRPFAHPAHRDLPCIGCHGSGTTHRQTVVRGPSDCATCHHDPRRELACTKCHGPGSIPAERSVRLSLSLKVAPAPRERDVTFQHAVHLKDGTGLGCRDCHATEVTMARNRSCNTCHQSHHDGVAACTSCHVRPAAGVHNAGVHLTCAGAGCHAAEHAPQPTLSRTLCLFCHADRQSHEPGGACAACHRIPGARGAEGGAQPAGRGRLP